MDVELRDSSRVGGRNAAVDVDDVARGLGRARTGEEADRLRDVLGIDVDPQLGATSVESLQLVLLDAVGARALRLPVRRPDARAGDDGVRVDGVDTDAVR